MPVLHYPTRISDRKIDKYYIRIAHCSNTRIVIRERIESNLVPFLERSEKFFFRLLGVRLLGIDQNFPQDRITILLCGFLDLWIIRAFICL